MCRNERIGESKTQHGMKYTRIYKLWQSMKGRCSHPKTNGYENYGGRGINVCQEWRDNFTSFYEWAKNNGYTDELTIDRIDKDGNYEPNNCRWVSRTDQMRNMRDTIYVTYKGNKYVLIDLLEELKRKHEYDKIRVRISRGWSLDESLSIPNNLSRHHYYFGEGLKVEFENKNIGYKITKSEFVQRYVSGGFSKRFSSYANNKYIKSLIIELSIKNNKFNLEKVAN